MNKKRLTVFLFSLFTFCHVIAQKDSGVLLQAIQKFIGCRQGTLRYGGTIIRKPFTATAELIVKKTGSPGQCVLIHIYTENSNEKTTYTLALSADSKKLNEATIVSERYTADGNPEIITEMPGFDHDNNKAATVKQTYIIGK